MAIDNIVLVHGAFADGSCWAKVIPLLRKRGVTAIAVQNPLSSLADDVSASHRVIDMQGSPRFSWSVTPGAAPSSRKLAIIPRLKA
jgi:hypothetical protein